MNFIAWYPKLICCRFFLTVYSFRNNENETFSHTKFFDNVFLGKIKQHFIRFCTLCVRDFFSLLFLYMILAHERVSNSRFARDLVRWPLSKFKARVSGLRIQRVRLFSRLHTRISRLSDGTLPGISGDQQHDLEDYTYGSLTISNLGATLLNRRKRRSHKKNKWIYTYIHSCPNV